MKPTTFVKLIEKMATQANVIAGSNTAYNVYENVPELVN